ncbi:MAG TPA: hypothetical protein VH306_10230 [Gaiellaceae bacterium]|jgi:hypothetical protein
MPTRSEIQEAAARRQSLFREVNDRILEHLGDADEAEFLCECVDLDCHQVLSLAVADYQLVRADPRLFIVAPGHVIPEAEHIVRRESSFVVVEKHERAGEVAEEVRP